MTTGTPELAPNLDPTPDDRLLQAEAMVRAFCGWHIAPSRDETLVLDGRGGCNLMLPSLYVTAITSVVENGVDLVEGTDFTWSQAGWVFRSSWAGGWWYDAGDYGSSFPIPGWWTTQLRGVVVELTHGYEDVPAEVTAVVQAVGQRLVDNPTGLEQQVVGPFSEKYGTSDALFSTGDHAVLEHYRLPRRP